ncbi:radical SAM protein [candidate division KSB1 bacterium]|nr:radical SAM protein [candidate division KSB1 bacterium]
MKVEVKKTSSLTDNFGRKLNYLRLSVTDQCNLHCTYCKPYSQILINSKAERLSWSELLRIVEIFTCELGINKLRLTGGEPFIRSGLQDFIYTIRGKYPSLSLYITSNGVLISPWIKDLKQSNISGINLSLDSLDPERYYRLTGVNRLDQVLQNLHELLAKDIPVKINTVVLDDMPVSELLSLAALAQKLPVEVRFIEHMAISRTSNQNKPPNYTAKVLEEILKYHYPKLSMLENENTTARRFAVPSFRGTIGIIAGDSRTFCETCNRMRVTARGQLKFCLYDGGVISVIDMIRQGKDNVEIANRIYTAAQHRFQDGNAAQNACAALSIADMVDIGG